MGITMNKQEELYFKHLTKDRADSANTLEKPSMRGIKNSVVEKYSDQAHFIYELLQNADDAKATNARFILHHNYLIFAHNGKRQFSISNPDSEDVDVENGKLGDINAITSIANSNKTEASIGKFGVGFKAVFQYTSTPYVYDSKFRFRIDRFIVPTLLEKDHPERKPNETLFVFPFDHPKRTSEEAYEDILNKMRNLSYPLLFLTNLKDIEYEYDNKVGLYEKSIDFSSDFDETTVERITLTQNDGEEFYDHNLYLFTRKDESDRQYSVGYFINEEGGLKPVNIPAFCFFPTKEVTGLRFIIHAPFLLTDSREGIRAGIPHNEKMINQLAQLSADAIPILIEIGDLEQHRIIDDSILNIIPYDPDTFSDPDDKSRISFLPFFKTIKKAFEEKNIIPAKNGYTNSENSYWAAVTQLTELFSDEQLSMITRNKSAKWVFSSLGRDEVQRNNKALFNYIEDLVRTNVNEEAITTGRSREYYYNRVLGIRKPLEAIAGIDKDFIENQNIEWLNSFYKWLAESVPRTNRVKKKPIFLNQNGSACAAFDEQNNPILFLPIKEYGGLDIVNPRLLENEETRHFIEQIGIKEPSVKDQIYNIILPQYESGAEIDTDPHFLIFFKYYCECPNEEVENFIQLIEDCEFVTYYDDDVAYRGKASSLYMPTPELKNFLETDKTAKFVALDEYKNLVGASYEKKLISFLRELGIREDIQIITQEIEGRWRQDLPHTYSTRKVKWEENIIDGCKEIIDYIVDNEDQNKSVLLWNCLLNIIEKKCGTWRYKNLSELLSGKYYYFYYSPLYETFVSSDCTYLRESSWLFDKNGELVAPEDIYVDDLSPLYETESYFAQQLIEFLQINVNDSGQNDEDELLTDEQKRKIALANRIEDAGIKEADIEELIEIKRRREAKNSEVNNTHFADEESADQNNGPSETNDFDDKNDNAKKTTFTEKQPVIKDERIPSLSHVGKEKAEIINDIIEKSELTNSELDSDQEILNDFTDSDEYIPETVDYAKLIERAKERSANELSRITQYQDLQNQTVNARRYSYGWFKSLLELECISSNINSSNSREVSISFAKVEREPDTKRTLVLKYPSKNIPQFMEDLTDIPLVLHYEDTLKTLPIEVANIRSYTLRVKLKSNVSLDEIDFSSITSATIDAKNPVFLLEELKKKLFALGYDNSFDMQSNLCDNIEFVFGPPGTGKTTHLAKNVIIPMIRSGRNCKTLVLTPTNKAADVLVKKVMECSDDNPDYNEWLIRFGTTGDEKIEESPVYKEKTIDIREISQSVTVTTIARFSYDYFMPDGERLYLDAINWDYIIIDESSMIPLVYMVYPLYKKTPIKFIIAGDPFQIEPITSVNMWKNENIYTMVHLSSFTDPHTIPHNYKVDLLTTQYRSIPSIGNIFSNFAYGGILKHYRSEQTQKKLNIGGAYTIKTLNILKYPVSKYESIYKSKRLQRSPFHIYSAIFTYEYICNLAGKISSNNPGSMFTIGVIAPYRAQADIIDKLIAAESLPDEVDVQVGTIHGFQGDECDIIFAILNTPPAISSGKEMFLNKLNIINVSISRAKDYLFIVMPDDNTEDITNLKLVKHVEKLIKRSSQWIEYKTPDLEKQIFNDENYIENNAFSTSHHNVNVYGLPERKYEIRADDDAVDIQIHKKDNRNDHYEPDNYNVQEGKKVDDQSEHQEMISNDRQQIITENSEELQQKKDQEKGHRIHVTGLKTGDYYLVSYSGKLKNTITSEAIPMYTPRVRNNRSRLISVFVIPEDKCIYMSEDVFKVYGEAIIDEGTMELKAYTDNNLQKNNNQDLARSPKELKAYTDNNISKPSNRDFARSPNQTAKDLGMSVADLMNLYEADPSISSSGRMIGNKRIPYFTLEDIERIRNNNKQDTFKDTAILKEFEKYIDENKLTFSFKLVFLLAMLKLADSEGKVHMQDLLREYRAFYLNRLNNKLPVDKPNCIYTKEFLDDDFQMVRSILSNPFEKFERRRFIYYSADSKILAFNPLLWVQLTPQKRNDIKNKEQRYLREYYQRIEKLYQ